MPFTLNVIIEAFKGATSIYHYQLSQNPHHGDILGSALVLFTIIPKPISTNRIIDPYTMNFNVDYTSLETVSSS